MNSMLEMSVPDQDSKAMLTVMDDRTNPAYENEVEIYSYTAD